MWAGSYAKAIGPRASKSPRTWREGSQRCRNRWSGDTRGRTRGFYCGEAAAAYAQHGCRFVLSAQKTPRLVEQLQTTRWTGSPHTDADGQCEFRYQPEGWGRAYRFVALRYLKKA